MPIPEPLRLTDAELDAIFAAARPLDVGDRDGFLQEVARELASCGEIDPGVVHRVCAVVQRRFFDPADLAPCRRRPVKVQVR
jgi:hypothetical protein